MELEKMMELEKILGIVLVVFVLLVGSFFMYNYIKLRNQRIETMVAGLEILQHNVEYLKEMNFQLNCEPEEVDDR